MTAERARYRYRRTRHNSRCSPKQTLDRLKSIYSKNVPFRTSISPPYNKIHKRRSVFRNQTSRRRKAWRAIIFNSPAPFVRFSTNICPHIRQDTILLKTMSKKSVHGLFTVTKTLKLSTGDTSVQINAYMKTKNLPKLIGWAIFTKEGNCLHPETVHVFKEYRGQGVATFLYTAASKHGKILKGRDQTAAGIGFSAAFRKSKKRAF